LSERLAGDLVSGGGHGDPGNTFLALRGCPWTGLVASIRMAAVSV